VAHASGIEDAVLGRIIDVDVDVIALKPATIARWASGSGRAHLE
jgi:hypothetical protein